MEGANEGGDGRFWQVSAHFGYHGAAIAAAMTKSASALHENFDMYMPGLRRGMAEVAPATAIE